MANAIATENLLTGSTGWQFTNRSNTAIQGYTDQQAYNPGDTVTFYVSTNLAGTTYTITIYRLGWYSGNGGALKFTSASQTGVAQGIWNNGNNTFAVACSSCYYDSTTGLYEAGWTSSYTWQIPSTACTGVYFAMLQDQSGLQQAITFVVRGNTPADYLMVRPTMTDAAYNSWGNHSLYTNPTVDVKVSFLKPYAGVGGGGNVLQYDLQFIHWAESQGYNLSYCTDVDVSLGTVTLSNYRAILILGHNEYWTKSYRNNVEAAITAGQGVAFLGSNASYWQSRLESSHLGSIANKTVVCYKVLTGNSNLSTDPQYGVDNTIVTSQWRDAVLNRPEYTMIGIMYSSVIWNNVNVAWTAGPGATSVPEAAGTGLVNSSSYGSDLAGYEYDKTQAGSPANIQIIGQTAVQNSSNQADTTHTTRYVAASGAFVFASGSTSLTWALDTYRYTGGAPGSVAVISSIQNLFTNIMTQLVKSQKFFGAMNA